MSSNSVPTRPSVPHRGITTLLALVAPTAVLTAAAALTWSWREDLPDPVAVHWGTGEGPDGFASLTSSLATMAIIGVLMAVMFWAIGFWWGQLASTRRLSAGASVGTSAFVAGLQLGSLDMQRGLTDAADAGGVGAVLAIATLAALVVGIGAALLVPGDRPRAATSSVPEDAPRAALGTSERAAWVATIAGGPGVWIGASSILVTGVLAVVTREWWLLVIPALLLALFAGMLAWTVRVDSRGVHVRSALGWPRTHVPLASIEEASARDVAPFREFGGFGWRTGREGALGIVVRQGEGLEVVHSGGKRLIVTVDDAATAAALVNALAARAR